jgi:hypothetical protein
MELVEALLRQAVAARAKRFLDPVAASVRAGLDVVMARETQDEQVALRVVAAAQDRQAVVHLQLADRAGHAADLATPASRFDELAAPSGRELHRARPPIVRLAQPIANREIGQQRSKGSHLTG